MTRDGGAYGDALLVVRIESRDGRGAEHADNGNVHGDADMHGAGVRGNEEDTPAQKPRKHAEAHLPRKDMEAGVAALPHPFYADPNNLDIRRSAHHGDMIAAREIGVGDGGEVTGLPPFRHPARADIERDNLISGGETRCPKAFRLRLGLGGNPHLESGVINLADDPRIPQRRIVGPDLVHDFILVGTDAVKGERKSGLCIADDAPPARERRER